MTTRPAIDTSDYPYLQDNYAPVLDECAFDEGEGGLRVEGTIPANLTGAFMRNGPNIAWQPNHYVYPADGDGMIHAVYFKDGRVHYRNRWVRTAGFQVEEKLGRSCYGSVGKIYMPDEETLAAGGPASPLKNLANTNIVWHGGKLMALWEAGNAYALNSDLSTVGEWDYDGALKPGDGLTAHPKICGRTGELITCTQRWDAPFYTLRIMDKSGKQIREKIVDMPDRAIMHDLQICGDYVVIFYPPAFTNLEAGMTGGDPFIWNGDQATRICAIPRNGGEPIWFEKSTFFSWHFTNGFQSGDKLYVDYVWMATPPFGLDPNSGKESQLRNMHRMTLDLKTGAVTDEKLGATYCEFGRADDRLCGLPYRYGFAAASSASEWDGPNHGYSGVIRYDMDSGDAAFYDYGEGVNAGEPVHIPNPDSEKEEDGYLMAYVTDPKQGAFLSILSAGDIERGPLAKIFIPSRVPNGFHANWMQGLTL
ncbi:carotenoid oxygenase family protein [Oceanicoccus sp. KOV_DT_Chl]|uniref:carotenoid oxygenase family protein n=1 Tax=Oceanicoccus sp. KOV_DT_Chl TaxID=1904639 RepID=UPI000C7C2BAC|nr:carotenoid oxygenase family protein [Oceanicoccus sp. KOV_DT_Chl]